jgi:uncharacterized protein YndB with AHSA1/START domain
MTLSTDDRNLVLQRTVDVPPELLFKAWSTPEHLMPWFCPKPYRTIECEIDLRPGGIFFAQMVDPEGHKLPAEPGCYLEIVPNRKIVWTSALGPGYRPLTTSAAPWFFTAVLSFEPHGDGGCVYTATAIHSTREDAQSHDTMGFSVGWGLVLDQLVAYVKSTPMA